MVFTKISKPDGMPRRRRIVGPRERRMLLVNSLLYGTAALILLWPALAGALGSLAH